LIYALKKIFIMSNLIEILSKEIGSKKINLIISGGNSPRKFLIELIKKKNLIKYLRIFLSDERLAKKNKKHLNLINICHYFKKAGLDKQIKVLKKNSLKLRNIKNLSLNLKNNKTISILGMGEDGHFASIFPYSKKINYLLDIKNKPNLIITEKLGNPCYRRITMNLSMILESKKICLIINSKKKLNTFRKAIKLKNKYKYPIYSLYKEAKKKLYIFDAKTLKKIL